MNTNISPRGTIIKPPKGILIRKPLTDTPDLYPLNNYPQPHIMMCFSLRKLRTEYDGYCVDIQRSSDSVIQSFRFDGNQVDLTSIKTFVGAGSGYVTRWYDQSGNDRHVSGYSSSQISIIINGAVNYLYKNQPTITFTGGGGRLSFTNTLNRIITSGGMYGLSVAKMTVNKTSARIFDLSGTIDSSTNDKVGWTDGGITNLMNVITDLSITQHSSKFTTRSGSYFVIGNDILHMGSPPYYVFGYHIGTSYSLVGSVSEIIIFNNYYPLERIVSLVSNIRNYYGTIN